MNTKIVSVPVYRNAGFKRVLLTALLTTGVLAASANAYAAGCAAGKTLKDGVLTIFADRFRSQARNREDALDRLEQLLHRAHQRPKKRIATRPTRASKERRLEGKQRRGATKASRRKPRHD